MAEGKKRRLSRRDFLIAAGTAGAGLVVAIRLGTPPVRLRLAEFLEASAGPPGSIEAEPTAWFEIGCRPSVRVIFALCCRGNFLTLDEFRFEKVAPRKMALTTPSRAKIAPREKPSVSIFAKTVPNPVCGWFATS